MLKIDKSKLPKHIAIIMDGNGRWAKKRNLPRVFGHRAGIKSVRNVIESAREIGVKYISLYAFSTENWQRPKSEIKTLYQLLYQYIRKERENLKKHDIRIVVSGDISMLPKKVQKALNDLCKYTKSCSSLCVNLCLNYGARQEIVRAVNKILEEKIHSIDEKTFANYLYTKDMPDPDLLIRTSGELRISNFLLYQIAYTELYFTNVLWPDFSKKEFYKAIIHYQNRERRFGGL
ncbi:MAG: isoprenyl transferase [Elusimicrobiota bacterium]|nr:isoprenyl transferase [Elusimicrobiota bacterium]